MDSIPRLETDRLHLRAIFPHDAEGVFALFSDPQVARYYEFEAFTELAQAIELIQNITLWFQNDRAVRWGIFEKATGQLIGSCCFDTFLPNYHSINLGYNLRSEHWGQGLATEAVRQTITYAFEHGIVGPVNRIQALTAKENTSSEQVVRRLGFQHEGLMREYGFWKNTYHDMNLFSLIKKDWQGATNAKHPD